MVKAVKAGRLRGAFGSARQFWREVTEADLQSMAGEVAFNLVLAIFPALILFASLAGLIGPMLGLDNLLEQALSSLGQFVPPAALAAIVEPLTQALSVRSTEYIAFGLVFVVWAASNGTAVIIKSFNRAYGVRETRPFWYVRLVLAIGLTFLLFAILIAVFVLLVYGEPIAVISIRLLHLESTLVEFWSVLVWPLSALAMVLALDIFYWLGPNVRQTFRLFSMGAILATTVWLLFSFGFRVFVAFFSNFPATYGTIAGVIVLMLWLDNSALFIILGAKFNAMQQSAQRTPAPPAVVAEPLVAAAVPVSTPGNVLATSRRTPSSEWAREQRRLVAAALGLWTLLILVGSLRSGRSRD